MADEIMALERNGTWVMVDKPTSKGRDYYECFFPVAKMVTDNYQTFLVVYVDDILVARPHLSTIQRTKDYLHSLFTIKDLGEATFFGGQELQRSAAGFHLYKRKFAEEVVKDMELTNAKPALTPLPKNWKFGILGEGEILDDSAYRRLIGRLLYLNFTRSLEPTVPQWRFYIATVMSQYTTERRSEHAGVISSASRV
ncbi:hypothetical protein M569_00387 [Genlisea aurea]|uniref:Reverse transcriptase Ty1/copia-type domain-containing protein n=1 Tax=Genlisea aurea TaxID=192259 RepID=S8D4Q3_9LAMI|nr:hypothetical protein M569_00387 [Genlisea aurea]